MSDKKEWQPRYTPNGSIFMLTGLLSEVEEVGVYLTPTARKALRVEFGHYVEIRNDERGTCINRSVKDVNFVCKVMDNFAYLDEVSMALLAADLRDEITVTASTLQLDAP
jgi:hypothetical protein